MYWTDNASFYYTGATVQLTSPKDTVARDSLTTTKKKAQDQTSRHFVSAHSLMTDWHELMQIYKEAEWEKGTCLYEWQLATDSRAATRVGRDLVLTVPTGLEISLHPTPPSLPPAVFLSLSLSLTYTNYYPPAPGVIWQHTDV